MMATSITEHFGPLIDKILNANANVVVAVILAAGAIIVGLAGLSWIFKSEFGKALLGDFTQNPHSKIVRDFIWELATAAALIVFITLVSLFLDLVAQAVGESGIQNAKLEAERIEFFIGILHFLDTAIVVYIILRNAWKLVKADLPGLAAFIDDCFRHYGTWLRGKVLPTPKPKDASEG